MKFHALSPIVDGLKARSKFIRGLTPADPFASGVDAPQLDLSEHIGTSLNSFQEATEDEITALCSLVQRAVEGDRDAQVSLNRIRVESVQRAILPMANFASAYFDIVVLADDERPMVKSTAFNEMGFYYLSEDGATKNGRWNTVEDSTYIPLSTLASQGITWRPKDLYRGRRVADNLMNTFNLAYDLSMQLESKCKALLAAAATTFVTSGKVTSRTYQHHSSVNTANLPTTNVVEIAGSTTTTNFRTKIADAVFKYCLSWGVNSSPAGALTPTGVIYVPAIDASALLDEVPITGTANNPVANALMNNFLRFERGGVLWTVVPDATLAPNVCYPVLNQKVGTLYLKPSQDEVFDDSASIEARRKNLATRSQTKVIGAYIPVQNRPNYLEVRYRTTG